MKETIDYILNFLLGFPKSNAICNTIGYTADSNNFPNYKVVIVPSAFFSKSVFGKPSSMPQLPLAEIEGTPILFGLPIIEKQDETFICHADFVASTFFLISRYEELIVNERDTHNRFAGATSLLGRAGLLQRPIVDEYGKILRNLLRQSGVDLPEETTSFSGMYLTHDVDGIAQYRTLRGFCGGIYRSLPDFNKIKKVFAATRCLENDPFYTFSWLLEQDRKVPFSQSVFFFKAGKSKNKFDKPCYNLQSKDAQQLLNFCNSNRCQIGLHTSYYSGSHPQVILSEKRRLQRTIKQNVVFNRYHYLRSCSPDDMQTLADIGITDDFTMGFADTIGFRLATCRPVRFINPKTMKLTHLTLHPLSVMECTLLEKRYMNLSYSRAMFNIKQLLNEIFKHNGEVVLLWHNTSVSNETKNVYGNLYKKTLKHINKLILSDEVC